MTVSLWPVVLAAGGLARAPLGLWLPALRQLAAGPGRARGLQSRFRLVGLAFHRLKASYLCEHSLLAPLSAGPVAPG